MALDLQMSASLGNFKLLTFCRPRSMLRWQRVWQAILLMKGQSKGGLIYNMEGAGSDGRPTPAFAAYGATKRSLRQLNGSLQVCCTSLSLSLSLSLSHGHLLSTLQRS